MMFVFNVCARERPTTHEPTTALCAAAQQAAPGLKLHDLKGAPHSLEDYRGKPVLLNFWATWCVPCAAEMPLLSEMQKQYQGKVLFIAASIDDEDMKPQVEAFIKKHQGEALTVMMGATLDSLDDFGVNQGMPGTVFIDAEGKIVDRRNRRAEAGGPGTTIAEAGGRAGSSANSHPRQSRQEKSQQIIAERKLSRRRKKCSSLAF